MAEIYKQSKWGFAILGVASFYIGQAIFGIILYFLAAYFGWDIFDGNSDTLINFLGLPFGILTVYILYKVLEANWIDKQPEFDDLDL